MDTPPNLILSQTEFALSARNLSQRQKKQNSQLAMDSWGPLPVGLPVYLRPFDRAVRREVKASPLAYSSIARDVALQEALGEVADQLLRLLGVVEFPGPAQRRPDRRLQSRR